MNCIIIDDSANALELMKAHISKISFLNLIGSFQSVLQSLETINQEKIDLIFSDINMPSISGIQFAKNVNRNALIIFTTAYPEYALQGYEVNAIDYLLKPISFEKFLVAVNKAFEYHRLKNDRLNTKNEFSVNDFVIFKSPDGLHRVSMTNILYLESKGNYVLIRLDNGEGFRSLMNMKEAMEKLRDGNFYRCHRGFIVSLDHIDRITVSDLHLKEHKIPIGKSYRQELLERIKT